MPGVLLVPPGPHLLGLISSPGTPGPKAQWIENLPKS
jgi:hypothetical protein